MTYSPGDPGHMLAHSDLVAAVNAELTRFGMAADLPTRALGDEGHLDDHNAIRGALATIEATAGRTFGTALPPVRNLGDAGHVDDHTALLACALEASTWPAFNDCTGGTVTTVDNYNGSTERWRIHTWDTTAGGTLTVTKAVQPFRVLAVGGGGGNGNYTQDSAGNGPGDGGQVFTNDAYTLSVGAYSFTIGAGGGARTSGDGAGGSGTATTAFGQTLNGGGVHGPSSTNRYRWGKGSAFQGAVHSYEYSRGVASDISGAPLEYGQGGSGYPGPIQYVGNGNLWTYGTGGQAWDSIVNGEGFGGSRDGNTGAVIVAYRIG